MALGLDIVITQNNVRVRTLFNIKEAAVLGPLAHPIAAALGP